MQSYSRSLAMPSVAPKVFNLIHQSDQLTIATWRHIVVHHWQVHASPTVNQMGMVFKVHESILREYPEGAASLGLIDENATGHPPEKGVVELCKSHVRSLAGRRFQVGLVYEGSSFVAAVVRSVVSGVVLAARPTFPMKTFCELGAAVGWLDQMTPLHDRARFDPNQLIADIERHRPPGTAPSHRRVSSAR